jgi:hypothetical protein
MEINKLKALTNNKAVWQILEEYLQEQITKTHKGLEVATSESELHRLQGKAAMLHQILNLREQLNNNG